MLTIGKMLLVDDDEGIRKSLSLYFEFRNCHIYTAENASQALIATEKELYDIIICEHLLPDMNGMRFFEILRNRCYSAIKVLLAAYGNIGGLGDIQGKGIDYVLTKPFSGEEVEEKMERLIASRCLLADRNCK